MQSTKQALKDPTSEAYRDTRRLHWDVVAKKGRPETVMRGCYHRRLAKVYDFLIGPGARVLEIGCAEGYPTYAAHRVADYYRALPRLVREGLIEPAVARLPVSTDNLSFDFKAKRFVQGAALPLGERHTVWMESYNAEQQRSLLSPEVLAACPDEEVFDEIQIYNHQNGHDVVERMMTLDATHYLSECVLFKVDRASMAASLETRVLFLDHTLIEFLAKVPIDLKLRGQFGKWTGKYILKRAMRDNLPHQVIKRPKKGFGMPVAKWVKGELRTLVRDAFAPERLKRRGLFNADYVGRLLDEHERGVADHRKLIWTLLMFEMWPLAAN